MLSPLVSYGVAVAGLALIISVPSSSDLQSGINAGTGINLMVIADSSNKPGRRLTCRRYLGCAPYSMPMLLETP